MQQNASFFPFFLSRVFRLSFGISMVILSCFLACKSPSGPSGTHHQYTNHLIDESSPYLLQHAHNPVDWYPWGEKALNKAKTEDKMLLISVGYAACHWCHVMEHESFEDTTVSKIMNEHFICIKVDREERPDIDDVYMTACQMSTGKSCGWPLNAFALPNGQPVWAGTYFKKKEWMDVLKYFIEERAKSPQKMEDYARQLTEGLQSQESISINTDKQNFSKDTLKKIAQNFLKNIDFKRGGRKGAPKFPMPNNYEFLLNYHFLYQDTRALEAVNTTLENMAFGGIYDHLGGGFARYSVDGNWKVPHFEKMLYDNGQLVSLYAQAFQLTKNPLYQEVVEETLTFIKREMTSEKGGFYSSLDADSEGEEGKFYVWQQEEIDAILSDPTENEIFRDYFEIRKNGNWEHGKNILYRKESRMDLAQKYNMEVAPLEALIKKQKNALFSAREKRIRPGLDDKVLTSWNALMLKGYIDAYRAFGKEEYLQAALKNAQFLDQEMIQEDKRLNRNYKDGKSVINAFLDDYALTAIAFTALYEATFDEKWLYRAKDLVDYAIVHFFEPSSGMFNYTSDLDPPLIARKKELGDNVIPGSNSSIARAMHLLGIYFYDENYLEKARQMMHNMSAQITDNEAPNFFSNWCSLYAHLVNPPYEIAIVGDQHQALRREMMRHYLPHALLLGGKDEGSLELLTNKLQDGETMIYVCQNKVCKFPVTEVDKAIGMMN
ncbi:MAG: thioredoxin domain-containing protein [Bacteroidota bacterium]